MPRKTLKERKERNPTDDDHNRVRSVIDSIDGTESPDDLMLMLLDILSESGKVPQEGKYYTFVYNPKTLNVRYDQNPLVAVTKVFNWGFKGIFTGVKLVSTLGMKLLDHYMKFMQMK